MNVRRLSRPFILLAIVAVIAAILLMPLALAAHMAGLSARKADGWLVSGSMRDVSIGPFFVGDVNMALAPTALVRGQLAYRLERGASAQDSGVSGTVGRGFGSYVAKAVRAPITPGPGLRSLGISQIILDGASVHFAGGKCQQASGALRLMLADSAVIGTLKNGLSGQAQCRNGDLLLPLSSQSGMERLLVRIKGNGQITATLLIMQPGPDIAPLLESAGFQPVPGGYRLVRSARLR